MVRRMTTGLRHAGLGPDRAVAMVVSLTPEAFAAHLAAHALGAVVVGVRPGWTASQLSAVLGRVDAVVVDDATATPELLELAGCRRPFPATVLARTTSWPRPMTACRSPWKPGRTTSPG